MLVGCVWFASHVLAVTSEAATPSPHAEVIGAQRAGGVRLGPFVLDMYGASLASPLGPPTLSMLTAGSSSQPVEQRLSVGATAALRKVRSATRRFAAALTGSLRRWGKWGRRAGLFVIIALLTPLFDRALIKTWRQHGFGAARAAVLLGLAVYIRLLLDARSSLLGKVLLLLALAYGVAKGDLLPDWEVPLGLVDDFVAVVAAARCFMWLCPDRLVREHARQAARARDRALRRSGYDGNRA